MQIRKHYSLLVYPFSHCLSGDKRKGQLENLNNCWHTWWRRFQSEKDGNKLLERALDDTYFFLPHLRELLFPETELLPAGYASDQLAEAQKLANLSAAELSEKFNPNGVLRLTYNQERLKNLNQIELIADNLCFPFRIHWIDAALFPQNVGFLVLKLELDTYPCKLTSINDFLYHLRLVHPPTISWRMPKWRLNKEEAYSFESRDLVDYLIQGLVNEDLIEGFDQFIQALKKTEPYKRPSNLGMGQVYGQAFREYSFALLDDAQANERASGSELFHTPAEHALYELATCTLTSETDYRPHPEGLKALMQKGHIALWDNWEAMALHDNTVFLATNSTRFTEGVLPHNVESDYFHLYLMVLYQKIRLSLMTGQKMRRTSERHRNLKDSRALWREFMEFQNRYWFVEATFKPQGTELYRRFQQALDVPMLYESVSEEVHELQQYYEEKADRRINTLLNIISFIGLPAALLFGVFESLGSIKANLSYFIIASVAVSIVAALLWVLWNRSGKY